MSNEITGYVEGQCPNCNSDLQYGAFVLKYDKQEHYSIGHQAVYCLEKMCNFHGVELSTITYQEDEPKSSFDKIVGTLKGMNNWKHGFII